MGGIHNSSLCDMTTSVVPIGDKVTDNAIASVVCYNITEGSVKFKLEAIYGQ